MVYVKVKIDNFMIGRTLFKKGEVIPLALPVARFVVKNGSCEYFVEPVEQTKLITADIEAETSEKAPVKKKRTYKRRDIKAES